MYKRALNVHMRVAAQQPPGDADVSIVATTCSEAQQLLTRVIRMDLPTNASSAP